MLDMAFVLGNKHVLSERRNLPILCELPAPIIVLRRLGEYFDNQRRIQEGVPMVVIKLEGAARYDNIRVGVEAGGLDFHPEIGGIHVTGTPT
jgi:hypothetical protein